MMIMNQQNPIDSPCLNAALEYADMGFSVIPVNQSNKKPYIKWTEYQHRIPEREEIEAWWKQWPNANVAIITGKVSGIFCVDADGDEGVEWISKNLPPTTVYSQTSRGWHAIYRVPENAMIRNMVKLTTQVDMRGEGGYFVAPPSIHESGHKYEFKFIEDGWESIPVYQPPTAGGTSGNIQLDLSGVKSSTTNSPVNSGQRNSTLAQLTGKWIGAGLDDEEIELLAKSWNEKNNPPLPFKEVLTTIKSIRKTHERNHQIEIVEPEIISEETEDFFPEHLLNPGGLLSEIIEYTTTVNPVTIKSFALAGALTFLGDLMAFKWQTETGLKTNLYTISLGYPGSGKNAPLKAIRRLIRSYDKCRSLPTRFTSGTAILKQLSNPGSRITIMLIDEIGDLLEGMKSPTSHKRDIPETLKTLFSGTDEGEEKGYATNESLIIPWSHLSFYGTGVPEAFWDSITTGDVTGGLLPRLLMFEYKGESSMYNDDYEYTGYDVPIDLSGKIQYIKSIDRPIDKSIGDTNAKPTPVIIRKSPDSKEIFTEFRKKCHDLQNQLRKDPSGCGAVYGRMAEHASKIALITTISKNTGAKFIDYESMKYAIDLVDHISAISIKNITDNIVDTDVARWKQKIIKGIKSSALDKKIPYPGASIRDLQRAVCRGLLKDQLDKILSSMITGGEIGQDTFKASNNKNIDFYFIAKRTPSQVSQPPCDGVNANNSNKNK